MKRHYLLLLGLFLAFILSFTTLQAQTSTNSGSQKLTSNLPDTANYPYWAQMMQDPNANFFEIQRAFNIYWENRQVTKGSGWKPFKRWEHYWETRVNPDGSFPAPDHVQKEYNDFLRRQPGGSRSTTGTWNELGPVFLPVNGTGQPNGMGRINCIAFHPNNANIYYVGAPSGGLWKTTNGGSSWTGLTDNLPTLGVSSILFDPTNPSIMYIGTGDRDANDAPGLGVYKSVDAGNSWTQSNSGMGNRTVGMMVMHPNNSSIILAASSQGIYKTTDGGVNWVSVQTYSGHYKDIKFNPANPNIVYATENGRFYRSTDGGDTFIQITSGIPNSGRIVIGVTPDDPNYVYCLLSQSSTFHGMYLSTDAGQTFNMQSDTPNILGYQANGSDNGGQGWYDLCIAVDPNDKNTLYTGGINIWKSTDAGVNWTLNAHWVGSGGVPAVHADQHALEYSPVSGKLFACHDGGIHETNNGGNTWTEISSGLAIAQIYRIGSSTQIPNLVMNGYQDNGSAVWDGAWRTEMGGDGMECIVDPTDTNYIYGSIYFGSIRRSTNHGVNFSTVAADGTNGITESGAWITPYVLDRNDPNIMYAGYRNIWRSNNIKASSGINFDKISNNLAGTNSPTIRDIKQSAANTDLMFVSRSGNKFFRTENLSATQPVWFNLSGGLPNNSLVRDIETHPYDQNIVYICQSNNVYKSTNKGSTWTDISGSLPNISMNCLVMDPLSHEGLYVGTDAGVYYIDSTLTDWVAFNGGLPVAVEVTELEIYHQANNYSGSRLRAATYGRGLWESDLYVPGTHSPIAHLNVSLTESNMCRPDTIQLLDYSAYTPTSWQWSIVPTTFTYVNNTDSSSQSPHVVFQEAGSYSVTLTASNGVGSDNTTSTAIIDISGGIPMPFHEDFESFDLCTGGCLATCNLTEGWYNYTNSISDTIDWRIDTAGTPSNTTGPSVDFNPGTNLGKYIYTEASFCFDNLAIMESPCIDLSYTSNPELKFAYHMDGFSMGDLHIDVFANGTWTNNVHPTISGGQGSNWNVDSTSLSNFAGEHIILRFRGLTGPNYSSDISLDDIGITTGPYSEFTSNDSVLCPGGQVQFTDLTLNNPTAWTWAFSPNTVTFVNGTNANSQNPVVEFNAFGTYTVSLTTTNANGSHNETKTQFINVSLPNANLSSNVVNNTICNGDSITFNAQPGQGTYIFEIDGTAVQISASPNYTSAAFSDGQEIKVTVTDNNGCSSTGPTQTVTVLPLPQPILTVNDADSAICEGDSLVFTETQGGQNFDFYVDNQLVQQGTSASYTSNSITDGQMISVVVEDQQGCEGSSVGLPITVYPIPAKPTIVAVGVDSLQATISGDTYQWWVDGTLLPFNSATIPAGGSGNYQVVVSANGCVSDTSEAFFYQSVGISGLAQEAGIRIYPNPNRGQFVFRMQQAVGANTLLRISDGLGRIVYNEQLKTVSGQSFETNINLGTLEAGIYFLEVQSAGQKHISSLVIEQ